MTRALAPTLLLFLAGVACARPAATPTPAPAPGTLAQVVSWKARPGKFDEYARYIREVAEPIDEEARRRGAFVSITTYETRDPASPWTHLRVFVLRDSAQLAALQGALDAAGARLEPDSVKRRQRGEYAATLRDRAAPTTIARIFR